MKRVILFCSIFFLVFILLIPGYSVFAEDKKPVKMVHTVPLSGILGSVPDTGYGLTDAATYINETGGIGGREFVGVVEDGRYDVPTTLGIFNRFAESEPKDEFLFYSQFCTPCLKALTEKVNQEDKIPVLAGSMSALIFDEKVKQKTPFFFASGPGYGEQWGMVLKYIKANHKKGDHKELVTIEDIVAHIDHICQLAGNANHVAIGSDLDGGFGNEQTPHDLRTIADLQKLDQVLSDRGYSDDDIDRIFHGNYLQFFMENLP